MADSLGVLYMGHKYPPSKKRDFPAWLLIVRVQDIPEILKNPRDGVV